jgi:hypothetical protein
VVGGRRRERKQPVRARKNRARLAEHAFETQQRHHASPSFIRATRQDALADTLLRSPTSTRGTGDGQCMMNTYRCVCDRTLVCVSSQHVARRALLVIAAAQRPQSRRLCVCPQPPLPAASATTPCEQWATVAAGGPWPGVNSPGRGGASLGGGLGRAHDSGIVVVGGVWS